MAMAELEAEESLMTSATEKKKHKAHKAGASLNMQGVFLHIVSDAIGSLIVIVTALACIYFPDELWLTRYMDPSLSIAMVCLMVFTTFPLVRETALILLQTTPKFVDVEQLKEGLLNVEGIEAIHEFHVWRLVGERIIATVHVRFTSLKHYVSAAERLRALFHDHHIHSATIQPEFAEMNSTSGPTMECRLSCLPTNCHLSNAGVTCCLVDKQKKSIQGANELSSLIEANGENAVELDVRNGETNIE